MFLSVQSLNLLHKSFAWKALFGYKKRQYYKLFVCGVLKDDFFAWTGTIAY